jgi:hypothetical protein
MPTPFTHLATVSEILARPELVPAVKTSLLADLPAFLLGNTAPDVQTISGQAREATHFFAVPLGGGAPAWRKPRPCRRPRPRSWRATWRI